MPSLTAKIKITVGSELDSDAKMRFMDDVTMHFAKLGDISNINKNKKTNAVSFEFTRTNGS